MTIDQKIKQLKDQERKLFDQYNWRAQAPVKLNVLETLIKVITQISVLEEVKN